MALDFANPYARITPALSASAQDFSFGKSVWDVVNGNPDGESVSGVAGISLIDGEGNNRRGRDKDKDEGGLSWDDLRDARERMRAEIANISLINGQFHIFGMQIAEEDMDAVVKDKIENYETFSDEHNMSAQDKQSFIQWLHYYDNLPDGSPEKARALRELAEIDYEAAQQIALEANDRQSMRLAHEASREEAASAGVAATEDTATFVTARAETLDDANLVGESLAAREGLSVVGSTDLASSFEAGFSATPEFNAQASGNIQFAQVELQQSAPNQSAPAIATL